MPANALETCRLCEWNKPYSGCIFGEEALAKTETFATESVKIERKAHKALLELKSRSLQRSYTNHDLVRILALGIRIDLGLFNIKFKLDELKNDLTQKSATGCEVAKIMLTKYQDLG